MKKNMKMKKLLVLLALMLVLAGCGLVGGQGTVAPGGAEVPARETITLRFSWWGADARHVPYLAAIELYEYLNPHIRITGEFQGFDGYRDRLLTQLAGGNEPDMMVIGVPWYPEIVASGDFFVDVNDFPGVFDFSTWNYEFVQNYGYFDGRLVAIPMGYSSRVFFINADTAAKVGGLNYGERYTWETLYQDGVRINQEFPDIYLAAPTANELLLISAEFMKQKVGNLFTDDFERAFTEDDLVELFEWVYRCYRGGVFQHLGEANLFAGSGEQNPLWISGNIIGNFQYCPGATRFMSTLPRGGEEMDVIPFPQHHNAMDGAALLRPNFMASISANSDHPEEAIAFLSWFLNDPEAGRLLGSANGTPVSQVQQDIVLTYDLLEPLMLRGLELGRENPARPENAATQNHELLTILENFLAEVAMFGATPEDAASRAVVVLDSALDRLRN